jgi:isoleucyl-tRNA synthetase
MFGDCFGTNIPESGHTVPAGCRFAGSGLAAFFGGSFFGGSFFAGACFAGPVLFAAGFAGAVFFAAGFAARPDACLGTAFAGTFLAGAFADAFAAGFATFPAAGRLATAFLAAVLLAAVLLAVFAAGRVAVVVRPGACFAAAVFVAGAPDGRAAAFFTVVVLLAGAAFFAFAFAVAFVAAFAGALAIEHPSGEGGQEAWQVSTARGAGEVPNMVRSVAFDPVDPRLDLVALEDRVLARWKADDVFAESLRRRADAPEWVFYEGPPTANGRPGIHHVWARLFKDIYPRFHTMRGRYVARKAGWDCHGLPVEVEVEKELGFSGKPQIEDYGIEAFNQRCRESVQRYVEDWSALTSRIGMWLDLSDAYTTMSNEFIESVWWQFSELWRKGFIYEGSKVVPYCGRCGTALSSHELGQPGAYQDVTEDSVYVRFPLVDGDADLLVWTTTPWTLVSNVGAAVGPDIDYVRVRDPEGGRDLVLAATRVTAVLGDAAEVVRAVPVEELVGRRYERPFDWLSAEGDGWRVVAADFVTVDDGSGIVHLAPAFGEVDREVGEAEGLPMLNPVNAQARFEPSVPAVAGRFVKEADPELIEELRTRGVLVVVEPYEHSYPHCWRCGTPLIYWAKPTWFARTSEHKDEMLRENERIGWHPEHIRHGRFGDWLANNVDWALSRDRFWGTPIPVWRCTGCGHDTCVRSITDLSVRAGRDLADLDLHRPFVDDVAIPCEECGGRALRVEPVLDAWFDSGSMPAAQWHHPFENTEVFERRFPADFICEAIDQTRGWFYSLLAVNTLVFGRSPYRNVVCLALLLDQDGQKMSKSRGNVMDPWQVITSRGADAVRWNFAYASSPWTPKRVYLESIDETTNRFLVTLWNTYSFFVTYANLDGWQPPLSPPSRERDEQHVMDRWIRSRLHTTVREATEGFDAFDALRATQALDAFVDDLSNWYVRRSRARFWKASDGAAHAVLHECLRTVALLLAPVCPFVADTLYQNLAGTTESVHLADWPDHDASAIDPALEADMAIARELVSLGLKARAESKRRVRQPLPRAIALVPGDGAVQSAIATEIADALNVKRIETVTSLAGLLDYTVLPNFRALGPKVGKRLPRVKELLAEVDGAEVQAALDVDGQYLLDVDGEELALGAEELQIRASSHEELALAQEGTLAIALDTTIDDALRREGLAREVVRAVNDQRKAQGYEIADRIHLTLAAEAELGEAIAEHHDWIAGEVLATRLDRGDPGPGALSVTIDGAALRMSIRPSD